MIMRSERAKLFIGMSVAVQLYVIGVLFVYGLTVIDM